MLVLDCIFKTGGVDVPVIVIEARVESNRVIAEAADCFGDYSDL
jgi:hypothetical protein